MDFVVDVFTLQPQSLSLILPGLLYVLGCQKGLCLLETLSSIWTFKMKMAKLGSEKRASNVDTNFRGTLDNVRLHVSLWEKGKPQQLKEERIPRFPLLGVFNVKGLSTCPVSIISLDLSKGDYKTREDEFVKLQHSPGIPHFAKHVQINFCKSLLQSQLIKSF